MAAYNIFLKEVVKDVFTNTGGTALAILGRETLQPTNPSVAIECATSVAGARDIVKFALPEALVTELNEGAKVIKFVLWVNVKASGTVVRWKLGLVSPALEQSSPTTEGTTQYWFKLELTKAQAEELTREKLEALEAFLEHLTATSSKAYEIYAELETEAGAGKKVVEGSASIRGGGVIETAGKAIKTGVARLLGGGRVVATGKVTFVGTATVRGGGRVTASASAIRLSTAAISGGGLVRASGGKLAIGGAATLAGGGRVAATGQRVAVGSASIRGGGRITTSGIVIHTGSVIIRGGGQVTATAIAIKMGTATIKGGGSIVTVIPIVPPPVPTMRIIYAVAEGSTTIPSTIVSGTQIASDMEVIQ